MEVVSNMGVRRFFTDFFNKMDSVDRLFDPKGAKLDALDKELQARFPDTYTFFSEEEKKKLIDMTVGERLDYYATLKPKFAALDPAPAEPPGKGPAPKPLDGLLRSMHSKEECFDLERTEEQRIRTKWANEPEEMQRRLDMLHNTFMRYRAERGW